MTVFDILNLIGGLYLFLFGMNVMGDGLEKRTGGSLKALLSKLTSSKVSTKSFTEPESKTKGGNTNGNLQKGW